MHLRRKIKLLQRTIAIEEGAIRTQRMIAVLMLCLGIVANVSVSILSKLGYAEHGWCSGSAEMATF